MHSTQHPVVSVYSMSEFTFFFFFFKQKTAYEISTRDWEFRRVLFRSHLVARPRHGGVERARLVGVERQVVGEVVAPRAGLARAARELAGDVAIDLVAELDIVELGVERAGVVERLCPARPVDDHRPPQAAPERSFDVVAVRRGERLD